MRFDQSIQVAQSNQSCKSKKSEKSRGDGQAGVDLRQIN